MYITIPYNKPIETPLDVREFFDILLANSISFHPEDSFTNFDCFTIEEANRLDLLMEQCYNVVEDPCEIAWIALQAFTKEE